MVRSVERYPPETIVVVHAKIRKAEKRVRNATIHDYELQVNEVHKVGSLSEHVPFTVYDAENINRDREDADEEVDDTAILSEESSEKNTPRDSTDISRIPGIDSKSKCQPSHGREDN
jgi:aspartyl-tRNA synthetase